jgi:DNA-binding MarR family transcriptional regulator
MTDVEQLDIAIGTLLRILTIDERRFSSDLGTVPLNPIDLETLSYLHRRPGSVAKDVSNFLGVRATTMQSVVDRLHRRGFVQRDKMALKGRAVALTLTKDGLKLRETLHAQNLNNCREMLHSLVASERPLFVRNMVNIAEVFSRKS